MVGRRYDNSLAARVRHADETYGRTVAAKYPERQIIFLNKGISDDVAPGLRDPWTDDALIHNPDMVSVLVGINDRHRRFPPDPL